MTELPPLVLTGASGFVGRRLLHALVLQAASTRPPRQVTILARSPASLSAGMSLPKSWQIVKWDLEDASALPPGILQPDSVVLHLASATGRAGAATMRATIVEGTRRLVEACSGAEVRHLIVVSSIAAGFADRRWYPYAEAKREAEETALRGGAPATIVRPTMVFGPGSPVQEGLVRLATGPLPLLFGAGSVEVQPVAVEDLVSVLVGLADELPPGGEVLEVGGPERLTIRELLAQIRSARGLPPRQPRALPLGFLRRALAAMEAVVGTSLPLTAGQLASFQNASTATPHPTVQRLLPHPRPLAAMLNPDPTPSTPGVPSATVGDDALAREFAVFARYLGCPAPGPDATAAYVCAHPLPLLQAEDALDRRLLRVASQSTRGCALADSYARLARPYGPVRRKLVLTLAVLESTAGNHAAFDTALASPRVMAWAAITMHGLRWVAWTVAAVTVLGPAHLLDRRPRQATAGRRG